MLGNLRKIFQSLKQDNLDTFDRLEVTESQDIFEVPQITNQKEFLQTSDISEDFQEFEEPEDFSDLFDVLDNVERPTSKQNIKMDKKTDNKVVNIDQFRKAAPKSEKAVEAVDDAAGDMCALPDNLISNDWSKGRAIVDWTHAQ